MRSTARKTYGKTASGKQITDELIDALARKAEAGYEIEEMSDRSGLRLLAERLRRADGLVGGWDDESIQIGQLNGPGAECAPRYAVDDPRSG